MYIIPNSSSYSETSSFSLSGDFLSILIQALVINPIRTVQIRVEFPPGFLRGQSMEGMEMEHEGMFEFESPWAGALVTGKRSIGSITNSHFMFL